MVVMCLSFTKETGCSAFTFTVCHCVPRCSAMTYASTCSRQTTHVFEYLHWLTDWRQNESKLESDTGISPLEQKQLVEMIISVEKCEWRRRRRRCQRQSQKHLLPRDVFWDIFIFVAAERNSRLAIVRRSRWRWRWWWRREERWRLSLLPTPTAAAAKITFVFRFAHFNSLSLSFAYSLLNSVSLSFNISLSLSLPLLHYSLFLIQTHSLNISLSSSPLYFIPFVH